MGSRADYESAISEVKHGTFNYILYFVAIPGTWSIIFETMSMSYFFPIADCEYGIEFHQKGILNASVYIGMICSGFIWGILSDMYGRKTIMIIGFFLDFLSVIGQGFCNNLSQLIVCNFIGGLFVNGSYSALSTYISEVNSASNRIKAQMIKGLIITMASIFLPLLAWTTLPFKLSFELYEDYTFTSYNLFLLLCSIPSFLAGVAFIFLPESPKYLLNVGRNEEAIKNLQTIYNWNTGQPKDSFPVKELVDDTQEYKDKYSALKRGFDDVKTLCLPPLLKYEILVCVVFSLFSLSVITLRLWLPQVFQTSSDYESNYNKTDSLCEMLKIIETTNITKICETSSTNIAYIDNVICGVGAVVLSIIAICTVDKVGNKFVMVICSLVAGVCAGVMSLARGRYVVLTLATLFYAFGGIGLNIVVAICVDFFPNNAKSVTIALLLLMGRIGIIAGNVLFPYFLQQGCSIPFITLGSIMFCAALLSITLPTGDLVSLASQAT